jgi:hypothetical protein
MDFNKLSKEDKDIVIKGTRLSIVLQSHKNDLAFEENLVNQHQDLQEKINHRKGFIEFLSDESNLHIVDSYIDPNAEFEKYLQTVK